MKIQLNPETLTTGEMMLTHGFKLIMYYIVSTGISVGAMIIFFLYILKGDEDNEKTEEAKN